MTESGFRLRGLDFTGPGAGSARVDLVDGVNIVYGASNTGKSFIGKALDFMLGGARPLPTIDEIAPYTALLLRLLMPDGAPLTLYRALTGGPYLAFEGLHHERPQGSNGGAPLKATHDPNSTDNLSMFLLDAIGLGARPLVKNSEFGEKETLSIRRLIPYVIVGETPIMAEGSPVLSGQHTLDTVEKNVLRLLLTGKDDAAVVTTVKPQIRKARVGGQIDLLDEMIARIDAEIGEGRPSREDLKKQEAKLDEALSDLHTHLVAKQERIDALVKERRSVLDRLDEIAARRNEIEVTLERFRMLDAVFCSDIERLEALEEGGSLLVAISGRPCPLCGSDPEHQRHRHGADEIRGTQAAALAEIAKIRLERRDLAQTMTALQADHAGLSRISTGLIERRKEIEGELLNLRPKETELKANYEHLISARDDVKRAIDRYLDRDRLVVRRSELQLKEPKGQKPERVFTGIDSTTAFKFAQTVEDILRAWRFPGDPKVSFNMSTYDIQVNGKDREANGKGVRAILHAAFKVAVLVYCRENRLPHPGFLILDTPLLTYREPLKNPKYGDLTPDEEEIKATNLDEYFYAFLHDCRDLGQFIVLENADPPASAAAGANVIAFTGGQGVGRFGLFPVG